MLTLGRSRSTLRSRFGSNCAASCQKYQRRFPRLVSPALIIILIALSACQRGEDSSLDNGVQSSDVEPVENIGEEVQDQASVEEESKLVDSDSVELTPAVSSNVESSVRESLVEDFQFSTIDEASTSTPIDINDEEPYCLDRADSPQASNAVSIVQACKQISDRLASVSAQACQSAQLKKTQCESVAGFPILSREFPPVEDRQPQGRILIIGGTHGDELTSVSVVFRWISKLNKYHSGLFHWRIIPMMNPDGVLRKAATRTNENGVDLNRNLPSDDWSETALRYWIDKQSKNPRRYPGEAAASEPETQWLIDEINAFKPDAIISVHAPYGVVDFDALLLNTAPKSLGKLSLNLLGTYPGSLGNYAGINRDIPVITLELPHSWVMPSEAETTKIWEDIVRWTRKNIGTDIAKTENK